MVGFAFAWLALVVLKQVEQRLTQDKRGTLKFVVDRGTMSEDALRDRIRGAGLKIKSWHVQYQHGRLSGESVVEWRGLERDASTPSLVKELAETEGVRRVGWEC